MFGRVLTRVLMLVLARDPQALPIQKGTRVLISLWGSLMFGRVLSRVLMLLLVLAQVRQIVGWLPAGRRLIVGFYATGHSSLGSPSARYVREIIPTILDQPGVARPATTTTAISGEFPSLPPKTRVRHSACFKNRQHELTLPRLTAAPPLPPAPRMIF